MLKPSPLPPPALQDYMHLQEQIKNQQHIPRHQWVIQFANIWNDPTLRTAWLEYFTVNPHHSLPVIEYADLLSTYLHENDSTEKERYRAINILRQEPEDATLSPLFTASRLHKVFNVRFSAKTTVELLTTGMSPIHFKNIIPISDEEDEKHAFIQLIERLEWRRIALTPWEWTPYVRYMLEHPCVDIRKAILKSIVAYMEDPNASPKRIIPKPTASNPSSATQQTRKTQYWNTSKENILKIVKTYAPELYPSFKISHLGMGLSAEKAMQYASTTGLSQIHTGHAQPIDPIYLES